MAMNGILSGGLPPGLDTFVLRQQEMEQKKLNDLKGMMGALSMQGILAKQDALARETQVKNQIAQALQNGGGAPGQMPPGLLGLLAQLKPELAMQYGFEKPQSYTLSPGQRRYGPGNGILATAPKIDMVNRGDRIEAVDVTKTQPGQELTINVSPNTAFTQDALDARHDRPSGSTIYGQGQQNYRQGRDHDLRRELHNTPSGTSREYGRGAGVFKLPNGSTVSRSQLMQQYKVENNLLDPFQISMYENSADPAMKALGKREREKLNSAVPFDQWASSKFGVDVYGAAPESAMPSDMDAAPGPLPAPAPQPPRIQPRPAGSTQPGPQAPRMGEVRKTLNGVNYVKRNGQWFQE
jgi:hypothetical protein